MGMCCYDLCQVLLICWAVIVTFIEIKWFLNGYRTGENLLFLASYKLKNFTVRFSQINDKLFAALVSEGLRVLFILSVKVRPL